MNAAAIECDARDPGPQRTAAAEFFGLFEDGQKNILHHVVQIAAPTEQSKRQPRHARRVDRDDPVERRAVAGDASGALVLYAMAMVVGPRLLVTLLDARTALTNDSELTELSNHASKVCVKEIRATGEVAKDQAPIEDREWQSLARALSETLDAAGNAESLGISR